MKLIYYLIVHAISFFQFDYCFLTSSEICKELREYYIKYCIKGHATGLKKTTT